MILVIRIRKFFIIYPKVTKFHFFVFSWPWLSMLALIPVGTYVISIRYIIILTSLAPKSLLFQCNDGALSVSFSYSTSLNYKLWLICAFFEHQVLSVKQPILRRISITRAVCRLSVPILV